MSAESRGPALFGNAPHIKSDNDTDDQSGGKSSSGSTTPIGLPDITEIIQGLERAATKNKDIEIKEATLIENEKQLEHWADRIDLLCNNPNVKPEMKAMLEHYRTLLINGKMRWNKVQGRIELTEEAEKEHRDRIKASIGA